MKPSAPKSKGPIRIEAIVPLAILAALAFAYFTLFFDAHLKSALEWGATQGNGAEVNIASLRTKFLALRIEVRGVEATDPELPARNRVGLGELVFDFSGDAALRAKAVIESAKIEGIELRSPRKSPGYVLPPPPPSEESGWMAQAKQKIVTTALAEASSLLDGLNPLDKLPKDLGALKSSQQVEAVKGLLDTREKEWAQRLAQMPKAEDFQALTAKLNALGGGGNSPAEIQGKIQRAREVIGEADAKVKLVTETGGKLTGDVGGFGQEVGRIDTALAEDKQGLERAMQLPRLDAAGLAQSIFGPLVLSRVGELHRYAAMARKYIPAKKPGSGDKPETPPVPRATGRTYQFARTQGSYPLFWLKRASISSTGAYSALGGDLSGELTDATTQPPLIGRPTVLKLKGDFPKQEVRGVRAVIILDHRGEVAKQSLDAEVDSFPMPAQVFSDSEALKFGFARAVAATKLKAQLVGLEFKVETESRFKEVVYEVKAQSAILQTILQRVTQELPVVELGATVTGALDRADFGLDLRSNLAGALERGFQKELQAKLAEARAKLDALLDEKVGKPKRELVAKFEGKKKELLAQVEARKAQANALKTQAQAKLDQLVKSSVAAPAAQALEGLRKKLPF